MMTLVILAVLLALTLLVVMSPLMRPSTITARASLNRELEASKTQLEQIKAEVESGFLDEDGARRARRAMERRILKLGERLDALDKEGDEPALANWIRYSVPAVIVLVAREFAVFACRLDRLCSGRFGWQRDDVEGCAGEQAGLVGLLESRLA